MALVILTPLLDWMLYPPQSSRNLHVVFWTNVIYSFSPLAFPLVAYFFLVCWIRICQMLTKVDVFVRELSVWNSFNSTHAKIFWYQFMHILPLKLMCLLVILQMFSCLFLIFEDQSTWGKLHSPLLGIGSLGADNLFWSDKILQQKYFDLHIA